MLKVVKKVKSKESLVQTRSNHCYIEPRRFCVLTLFSIAISLVVYLVFIASVVISLSNMAQNCFSVLFMLTMMWSIQILLAKSYVSRVIQEKQWSPYLIKNNTRYLAMNWYLKDLLCEILIFFN